jgi:uncharacterized membrane protein
LFVTLSIALHTEGKHLVQGTLTQSDARLLDNKVFLFSCFMSAGLRLVALLLYQTAIQLAPLSVTIPFLSFTPAMLIVTAYLMIGEQPSLPGIIGVLPKAPSAVGFFGHVHV